VSAMMSELQCRVDHKRRKLTIRPGHQRDESMSVGMLLLGSTGIDKPGNKVYISMTDLVATVATLAVAHSVCT
jgi:hypothetical protein